MSYASILRELKKRVNPDELGAAVQGIRKPRSKDLLVELKCSKKDRARLDTVFKEAVRASGAVHHLIPRIEVEFRVSLTKTPYRGNRKAFVLLEEARTLKLLKAAHIKIGWVSTQGGCARKRI